MEAIKKKSYRSKVRQFYSEFNSNSSSSETSEVDSEYFKFEEVHAPKITKRTDGWSSPGSQYSQRPILSPTNFNESQDTKELALDKHFQRKINDLKRKYGPVFFNILSLFYHFKEAKT